MNNRLDLHRLGFAGFSSVRTLLDVALASVPELPGVYIILRESVDLPRFLSHGSGGHFKAKNPNVDIAKLAKAWVPDTCVLYIGKAGGFDKGPTLRTRLRQYLEFAEGKAVGHWGGRYIWQLEDAEGLVVCWKPTPGEDPADVEADLIDAFEEAHGRLPFANLKKGQRQCRI